MTNYVNIKDKYDSSIDEKYYTGGLRKETSQRDNQTIS